MLGKILENIGKLKNYKNNHFLIKKISKATTTQCYINTKIKLTYKMYKMPSDT